MTDTFKHFYIPDRMMEGIKLYIQHGVRPGSFLQAIITNNLKEAVGRADDENRRNLPAHVEYFYNYAPYQCWGSEKIMNDWIHGKGAK